MDNVKRICLTWTAARWARAGCGRKPLVRGRRGISAWLLLAVVPVLGCGALSECVRDPAVGMNGGFEHAESGLPVNWLVYSPSTVPTGRFEVILDDEEYQEGRQSLKFVVRECSTVGGWRSPGIAQERPAVPGATYRLSFWIKNDGSDFVVRAGGVDAKTGQVTAVDPIDDGSGAWQYVEHALTVTPPYERLRFELSIRSPGTLWIDDVRIERIELDGPGDDRPTATSDAARRLRAHEVTS